MRQKPPKYNALEEALNRVAGQFQTLLEQWIMRSFCKTSCFKGESQIFAESTAEEPIVLFFRRKYYDARESDAVLHS